VIEVLTDSEWVVRCFEVFGYEVIVVDPNFVFMYAMCIRKVKIDCWDVWVLVEV